MRGVAAAQKGKRKAVPRYANASETFGGFDPRTKEARRLEAIKAAWIAELGGPDNLTLSQREILDTAANLRLEREIMDADRRAGGKFDVSAYTRTVKTLVPLLVLLGAKPPKEIQTKAAKAARPETAKEWGERMARERAEKAAAAALEALEQDDEDI